MQANAKLLAVILAITWLAANCLAQAMPQALRDDLIDNPARALRTLRANPKLAKSVSNEGSVTPLHLASQFGHLDIVMWLVGRRVDVNARCYNDFTPLHLAANGPVATALVRAGADLAVKDLWGLTAMQYAAQQANGDRRSVRDRVANPLGRIADKLAVVEAIRKGGQPLDATTALYLDKRNNARQIIRAKPRIAKRWRARGTTLLHIAAGNGDTGTAELLMAIGISVDVGEFVGDNFGGRYTPLAAAVLSRDITMVKFLCEKGANPNLMERFLEQELFHKQTAITRVLKHYSDLRKKGK